MKLNEPTLKTYAEADRPNGVTVREAGSGLTLMRTRTTGTLSLLLVPADQVTRLRAALEKWEAER